MTPALVMSTSSRASSARIPSAAALTDARSAWSHLTHSTSALVPPDLSSDSVFSAEAVCS